MRGAKSRGRCGKVGGCALLEVAHSAAEERLVFLPGDIPGNVGAAPFGVSHLAEDPATGTGNSFDREKGTVGVVRDVHAGIAVVVAILGGDLAIGGQLTDLVR